MGWMARFTTGIPLNTPTPKRTNPKPQQYFQIAIVILTPARYSLHMKDENMLTEGDRLLAALAALANPHRLRIVAALVSGGRNYVSQLAREVGISRPLLQLHLQKLAEAGLVTSQLELSQDGKALNYYEVTSFAIEVTPATIVKAAASLSTNTES